MSYKGNREPTWLGPSHLFYVRAPDLSQVGSKLGLVVLFISKIWGNFAVGNDLVEISPTLSPGNSEGYQVINDIVSTNTNCSYKEKSPGGE